MEKRLSTLSKFFFFALIALFSTTNEIIAQAPTDVTYEGPLVITSAATISGRNFASSASGTPAITIQTDEPVIIENCIIKSAGHCIYTNESNANVTIKNTAGYGLTPTVDNRMFGRFFYGEDAKNVKIENNYLENTSGIKIINFAGSGSSSETIKVRYNKAKNINGKNRLGADFSGDNGNFVQLDKVLGPNNNGVANIEIAWNQILNQIGESSVEDNISIYISRGTTNSPIKIHHNFIDGAFPANISSSGGTTGYSGGGIMVADRAGQNNYAIVSAYSHAYLNQVIRSANYGIAIAGGNNNLIENNRVISRNLTPSDAPIIRQGAVGIYVWNLDDQLPTSFYNNTAKDNFSGWVDRNIVQRNDYHFHSSGSIPDCTNCTGLGKVQPQNVSAITKALEDAEYVRWYDSIQANSINIGIAPIASITSPANNSVISSSVTINASASDRDGTISKVEFYLDNVKIGEDNATPYSFTLSNLTSGIHQLKVKAIDNNYASTTSSNVTITVNGTTPPPTGKIEAEGNYVEVTDIDSDLSTSNATEFSNGSSVKMNDVGDEIRLNFNATAGTYIIKVRLRSGSYNTSSGYDNNDDYWPTSGYTFKINGSAVSLAGDVGTISGQISAYGGSYWGTMVSSPIALVTGINSIDIKALKAYAGVDYIEVVPLLTKYEAESNYSILTGWDADGDIIVDNAPSRSGGATVRLADNGDKIRISFNSQSGNYIIKVHLRSGSYNSSTGYDNNDDYWPSNYSFTVNGVAKTFTGITSSISTQDGAYGGSYWGTMQSSTIVLNAGTNTLDIQTNKAWAGVDYITVEPTSGSGARVAIPEENIVFIEDNDVLEYPNPFVDKIYINSNEELEDISISDVDGNVVIINNSKIGDKESKHFVDLSNVQLKSGVYFLKKIYKNGKTEISRIIKQ